MTPTLRSPRSFLLLLLTIALCVVGVGSPSRARAATDTPEGTIRGFYAWYLGVVSTEGDVYGREKRGELRRYVSAPFLRRIDRAMKIEGGVESDPFLAAQDFDPAWGKNVVVRNVQISGETATAEATLNGKVMAPRRLRLGLRREDGAWKLDQVTGVD